MKRSSLLRFHSVSTTNGILKKTNAATAPQTSWNRRVQRVDRAVYAMFKKHCYTLLSVEQQKIHEIVVLK